MQDFMPIRMHISLWVGRGGGAGDGPRPHFPLSANGIAVPQNVMEKETEKSNSEVAWQTIGRTHCNALRGRLTSSVSSLDLLCAGRGGAGVGCITAPELSQLIHKRGMQGKEVTEQKETRGRHTPDVAQIPQKPASSFPFPSPTSSP